MWNGLRSVTSKLSGVSVNRLPHTTQQKDLMNDQNATSNNMYQPYQIQPTVCPTCGRCPTCHSYGYPYYPYQQPYTWTVPVTTTGGTLPQTSGYAGYTMNEQKPDQPTADDLMRYRNG